MSLKPISYNDVTKRYSC